MLLVFDFNNRVDPRCFIGFRFIVFIASEGKVCSCGKQTNNDQTNKGKSDYSVSSIAVFEQ